MNATTKSITELDFIAHFVQHAPQMMWFLGAGTSRTAGMPTATDIIWDLKRRYYCLHENQDISNHDINNKAIKNKIQAFLDSKGFPELWSAEEYAFYFEQTFGEDYAAQQRYIRQQLAPDKISLNIGHRVLAALLKMNLAKVVFTTNFDEVIEKAYSEVNGENLSCFHLEGSYAALEALNSENFPIYAKIHGDFRYQSIKNLPQDLLNNDQEIQKCFNAASTRYGLVVSGYSGRDQNVMSMIRDALSQNNAFSRGLFWITPRLSDVSDSVTELIKFAQEKNVSAHIIESGTFDILLSKIWRHLENKPKDIDLKVRTAQARTVSIPLPQPGNRYPLLRTNALAISNYPKDCGKIDYIEPITFSDLMTKVHAAKPKALVSHADKILFWGNSDEVRKALDESKVKSIDKKYFEDSISEIAKSGFLKSFFEEALAKALCWDKPLIPRRRKRTHYLVVNEKKTTDPIFQPLKEALAYNGRLGDISGQVYGIKDGGWAEAISIKIEERNGVLWLLLRPDIWINPISEREKASEFLKKRKIYRYNSKSYQIFDSWLKILFGSIGSGQEANVSCYSGSEYPATFTINTRTAYSRCGGG